MASKHASQKRYPPELRERAVRMALARIGVSEPRCRGEREAIRVLLATRAQAIEFRTRAIGETNAQHHADGRAGHTVNARIGCAPTGVPSQEPVNRATAARPPGGGSSS